MKLIMTLAALALTASAAGAQAPDSAAFVVRLGNDTLVLERFVRTPTRVRAEALIRSPATVLRRYDLQLNEQGGIRRFEAVEIDPVTNAFQRRDLLLTVGDTAVMLVLRSDSVAERRFAIPPNALPFLNLVQWPNELVVARARTVGDSVAVPYLSGANTTNFVIRRSSADSVTIRHPFRGVTRVHTDAQGRILHMDAGATTLKLTVERKPWLPLETLAPAIAARDANRPARELSPRGETSAVVDGANIMVDYGRPLKRGRVIFGNVVPYGQLWRTGANMATQLHTDRDLVVGGNTLPAGQYSIFSIPGPRTWSIIINRETNQNGNSYKAEHDFFRVPAQVRALPDTVEQFTILVSDETNGGALRFQWDQTEAVLPFTVK